MERGHTMLGHGGGGVQQGGEGGGVIITNTFESMNNNGLNSFP